MNPQVEAREHHWTQLPEERAQVREYLGHQLRVQIEDGGYRLFVDAAKRGFFDDASRARAHGIWLVDHGVPEWRGLDEVNTAGSFRNNGRRRETLYCPGPHDADDPRPAIAKGLCQFHRGQQILGIELAVPRRRRRKARP